MNVSECVAFEFGAVNGIDSDAVLELDDWDVQFDSEFQTDETPGEAVVQIERGGNAGLYYTMFDVTSYAHELATCELIPLVGFSRRVVMIVSAVGRDFLRIAV